MRLRLVTLNTWKCDGAYRERLPRMAAGLAALQPHIVLLQECFATADGSTHTARALADALGLPLWETPARAKPRLWQGHWVHSHAGLALLGDCEPVQALDLPPHPRDGERVAQIARWRGPGPALWIGHVHLAAGADAAAARLQQCQHLTDRLQALAQADSAVLGGDFNAEPQDPALAPLRAGWQRAGQGPAPATWWNFPPKTPDLARAGGPKWRLQPAPALAARVLLHALLHKVIHRSAAAGPWRRPWALVVP